MSIEDFTFPAFTDTVSSAIDSPPLWRLSPAASPDHHPCHNKTSKTNQEEAENSSDNEEEDEEYKDCFPMHTTIKNKQRKSFSWIEKNNSRFDDDDDDDEKMDILWEDLNEELSIEGSSSNNDNQETVNMGCVRSLRLSKTSKAMVPTRKPTASAGFVMFIKVLKKLFLLHNSHHRPVHNHCSRTRRAKNLSF